MTTTAVGDRGDQAVREGADRARDRAAAYRLLSWLLLENPDEGFVREMLAGDIDASLSFVDPAALAVAEGLQQMHDVLAAHRADDIGQLCQDLAIQRTRLFRGLSPARGPQPPYEAVYRASGTAAQRDVLLQMEQLYGDAGVAVPSDRAERPDYLGLELELMGLLCGEEADAWLDGNVDEALQRRHIQERLLREHLLLWVPRYCDLIRKEQGVPFYHGMVTALSTLLRADGAEFSTAS